jgi:transcriptional regulator with XRE-family HTH domain
MKPLKLKSKPCPYCGGSGIKEFFDGNELRKMRQLYGVSLRQMAKRLKYSAPYLSDVEAGKRNVTNRIAAEYRRYFEDGATNMNSEPLLEQ